MYQLLLHSYMGRLLHLNKNDSVKNNRRNQINA